MTAGLAEELARLRLDTGTDPGGPWWRAAAGGESWAELEARGLTGLPALEAVIAGMRPFPLVESIRVYAQTAGRDPDDLGLSWDQHLGVLDIVYLAPDAYAPERPGHKQQFRVMIPNGALYAEPAGEKAAGVREWAAWLCWVLSYLAVHEVAEFFVVGGVRLFDPHAKGARPVLELPPMPFMLRGRM